MCFKKLNFLDLYGQSVSLTYKGDDSFKSPLGTAISIVVLVLLMSFGIYKFIILIYRINPDVSQQSFLRDLDKEPVFRPYQETLRGGSTLNDSTSTRAFDFSFGVGRPIPPSIGFFTVNEVAVKYVKGSATKEKVKRPLDYAPCGT
jgi:hypothetical protein